MSGYDPSFGFWWSVWGGEWRVLELGGELGCEWIGGGQIGGGSGFLLFLGLAPGIDVDVGLAV